MFVVNHKKIFFAISATLVALSLFSILFLRLSASIEFTGGSLLQVEYKTERPAIDDIEKTTTGLLVGKMLLQPTGDRGLIIRTRELAAAEKNELLQRLSFNGDADLSLERYTLIGPSIGRELRTKAWIAVLVVLFAIILFITFAFRKAGMDNLSKGVSIRSWHYGLITIVTLAFDLVVPMGTFSFLGSQFLDLHIDVLFVTALLVILGYSVHDTIVVFDRIRENLRINKEEKSNKDLDRIVGEGLEQTYARSINTSLTTLLVVLALYILGGEVTKNFALMLGVGIIVGTYSSIFLATPLLLWFGTRGMWKM